MSPSPHLKALGEFLKARRSDRVAGLRRKEVTQPAAISTDNYTRLEQGCLPSPVLESVAQALDLDESQRSTDSL
ncbi:helix-turn-helix domain-containing protein [Streptomyces niveus]|uniref:helix-turn-helix domain-containing protein n=1 Tax=Streptomyces niveus TaxID=193462 RepID=UPI003435178B